MQPQFCTKLRQYFQIDVYDLYSIHKYSVYIHPLPRSVSLFRFMHLNEYIGEYYAYYSPRYSAKASRDVPREIYQRLTCQGSSPVVYQ